jgi:hypothetical protein
MASLVLSLSIYFGVQSDSSSDSYTAGDMGRYPCNRRLGRRPRECEQFEGETNAFASVKNWNTTAKY